MNCGEFIWVLTPLFTVVSELNICPGQPRLRWAEKRKLSALALSPSHIYSITGLARASQIASTMNLDDFKI
eukprot:SAG31_NODE_93_length_26250_cov_47.615082_5_plen_71_part_00